ncbi:hypothetical protein O181_104024 [Austropuccinia psidii MF-1]|uniref:Uncharacterized protein n=1 Tax=Austropuccinia psidii MF-1 TaxID=1389203 RepID=A0A9Q3JMC4_9BASI|nr:hypothetical protein [Austropuccinia psidii MF-1]
MLAGSQLQKNLSQKDHLISHLLERVQAMELQIKNKTSTKTLETPKVNSSTKAIRGNQYKERIQESQSRRTSKTSRGSFLNKRKTLKVQALQKMHDKRTMKSPLQMITKDYPAEFENIKEALQTHVKLLWGLIAQHAVPLSPDPTELKEFYQQFSNTDHIEVAISHEGPPLVPVDTIKTLHEAHQKHTKIGKHVLNLSDFSIKYVRIYLSQLGICTWAPNLLEPADSLYNEACCISALKTFRQLSVGGTYQFMNINLRYVNDFDLLAKAYDCYIHFYMEGIFCKEQKQTGKHRFDNQKKALQESSMRLRNERYKLAISQDFPKKYIRIVKPIQAHSDEEYSQEKEVYISRKLPFQSESANGHNQHCHQIHTKNPPTTDFCKAPKGLPIDFYNVCWFNEKLPSQKRNLADVGTIAFLRDATKSLEFKDEDEKIGNKRLTNKRWDEATKEYNLDFLVSPEQDSEDESIGDNDMDYGESIILESSDEYESNNDSENTQYKSKAAKDRKGKQKSNEEDFEADDMELDEEYGRATVAGGLTEEEWNAWQ